MLFLRDKLYIPKKEYRKFSKSFKRKIKSTFRTTLFNPNLCILKIRGIGCELFKKDRKACFTCKRAEFKINLLKKRKKFVTVERGDLGLIYNLFKDYQIKDQTKFPTRKYDFNFLWNNVSDKHKGFLQKKAVDDWMKYGYGQVCAPPRSGKCFFEGTIINTVKYGSIPINNLFSKNHKDGSAVPKILELATKDGIKKTSHIYCKTVDKTLVLTTSRGLSIRATPNEPIYVDRGFGYFWVNLDQICIGDKVLLGNNTNVFSKKTSKYIKLYSKYVLANKRFYKKVVLRVMKLAKENQMKFLKGLKKDNEIEINNKEVLKLLQIMLLNLGFPSKLIK